MQSAAAQFKLGISPAILDQSSWDENIRTRLVAFIEKYPQWTVRAISRDMQQYFGMKKDDDGRRMNTGLSEATLSNYIECKSQVGADAIRRLERRIVGWLDYREHAGKHVGKVREDYASYKQTRYAIAQAAISRQFVIVIGPSGIGKTLAAKHFGNAYTNGGFVFVEPYDGIRPRAFLAMLTEALGLEPRGDMDALIKTIRGHLREFPQIIVVDEADFVPQVTLNHLVHIWNAANIGIVLLGTRKFDDLLKSAGLERLRTRKRVTLYLSRPSVSEIAEVMREQFGKAADDDAIKAMQSFALSYRELDTLVGLAKDIWEKNPARSLPDIIRKVGPRKSGMNGEG